MSPLGAPSVCLRTSELQRRLFLKRSRRLLFLPNLKYLIIYFQTNLLVLRKPMYLFCLMMLLLLYLALRSISPKCWNFLMYSIFIILCFSRCKCFRADFCSVSFYWFILFIHVLFLFIYFLQCLHLGSQACSDCRVVAIVITLVWAAGDPPLQPYGCRPAPRLLWFGRFLVAMTSEVMGERCSPCGRIPTIWFTHLLRLSQDMIHLFAVLGLGAGLFLCGRDRETK